LKAHTKSNFLIEKWRGLPVKRAHRPWVFISFLELDMVITQVLTHRIPSQMNMTSKLKKKISNTSIWNSKDKNKFQLVYHQAMETLANIN